MQWRLMSFELCEHCDKIMWNPGYLSVLFPYQYFIGAWFAILVPEQNIFQYHKCHCTTTKMPEIMTQSVVNSIAISNKEYCLITE